MRRRAISERLEQDPAFYLKFSRMIQHAIDDFRAKRYSELEYLKKVTEIRKAVVCRKFDDVPQLLRGNENAVALFGVLKPFVASHLGGNGKGDDVIANVSIDIWEIIRRNQKVGFWDDLDAQRRTVNEIDDYLYDDVKDGKGIDLTLEEMDEIIERSMQLARHRIVN
jgi:type I restriction enzyme, R subunit